jgi:hypothetical protein
MRGVRAAGDISVRNFILACKNSQFSPHFMHRNTDGVRGNRKKFAIALNLRYICKKTTRP